ncbi:hypothetical protein [Isoptericola aurantiacus]|uniref:hypothetical protein n=1 Tax=Isoptericola aurantiacus TaxID=3377839 RepID=UPI003839ED1D
MRITIDISTLTRFLVISIAGLGVLHVLLVALTEWVLPDSGGLHIVDLFVNLDQEGGLPMWFSSVLLAVTGLVAFDLARADHAGRRAWIALGTVMVFLSLDEAATVHERIGAALEHNVSGIAELPFNVWVIVYVPFALLALLLFIPHLSALPAPVRNRILLAGALFVGGAAGLEIAVGLAHADPDSDRVLTQLFALGEELLEMSGVALLLLSLVAYRTQLDEIGAIASPESVP